MKQTIEVEVPDGRSLNLNFHSSEVERCLIGECLHLKIPLQPAWQYPEWLGGAGVACNQHGEWVCYSEPARIANIGMVCTEEYWVGGEEQPLFETWAFPLWTPPPCTDWRKSWHPNPRAK